MWVKYNGMLEVIIKDHNENSCWKFRHFLWKKIRIKLKFNMIFHLQINGQIGKINGILINSILKTIWRPIIGIGPSIKV